MHRLRDETQFLLGRGTPPLGDAVTLSALKKYRKVGIVQVYPRLRPISIQTVSASTTNMRIAAVDISDTIGRSRVKDAR